MEGIQGHRRKADSKTWSTVKDGEMRGDVREDGRGGWVGTIRKAKQIGSTELPSLDQNHDSRGFNSDGYDEKRKGEVSVISKSRIMQEQEG